MQILHLPLFIELLQKNATSGSLLILSWLLFALALTITKESNSDKRVVSSMEMLIDLLTMR